MNSILRCRQSGFSTPTHSAGNEISLRFALGCDHPTAIAANFIRVITLVLMAYYAGTDLLEGALHDLTGIGAVFGGSRPFIFLFDGFSGAVR